MDNSVEDQNQAEFYGVSVDELKKQQVKQDESKKKTRLIMVKENGKLVSKRVTEEELKEMNTPKFSKPGKGDPLNELKCGPYGSDVRNKVFGNK